MEAVVARMIFRPPGLHGVLRQQQSVTLCVTYAVELRELTAGLTAQVLPKRRFATQEFGKGRRQLSAELRRPSEPSLNLSRG
jgi:hypothetical protein